MRKLTKEEFIAKAREVHGDKYDYSKVEYVNNYTKVCIICPEHGEFWQTPSNHLSGHGCQDCSRNLKKDSELFAKCANEIHNNKYDYSKVNYVNSNTKVCIICQEHGEFWQTPRAHLSGQGCRECAKISRNESLRSNKDYFIEKAKSVHGDKYDYSLVNYIDSHKKICIICHRHGAFMQTPADHLSGKGCIKCAHEFLRNIHSKKNDDFIKESIEFHGNKYDYSKTNYINQRIKVCITCPIHGDFWQFPNNHLKGYGCPKCSASHGELRIEDYLKQNDIKYQSQYTIKIEPHMFSRNKLRVDFYLPDMNTIIEFNGEQHYKYNHFFHRDEDDFARQLDRDRRLRQYCKQYKIKLIEIKYDQIYKIYKILNRKLKLNNKH